MFATASTGCRDQGGALNPLEFIRYTPRTNCGDCGHPSCLAFAVAVTKGGENPAGCPHLDPAGLEAAGEQQQGGGLGRVERGQKERDIALVEHLKEKISEVEFAGIASRLGAEWSAARPDVLRFRYLGRQVELTRGGITMEGGFLVDPRDQILLYNYIASGGSTPPMGNWIGMESLPNSMSKVRTLAAYCEQPLARHFAGRPQELARACEKAGGQPVEEDVGATLAYVIPALPHLPLYILFWDQEPEEGFESRVKVLFDNLVLDYLDIESLVFTAERTADYLMESDS